MKKRILCALLLLLLLLPFAARGDTADWKTAPVITKAYELEAGKIYLEWQGSAPVYQIYMDGASVADVIVNSAVIPVKKGSHSIAVYPINETKAADTKIDVGIEVIGSLEMDLGALGLDPKKLSAGNPSRPLHIDYTADPLFNAVPDQLQAETDFDDTVLLSFADRYGADEYLITVKNRKDVSYVRFNTGSREARPYISKANSTVILTLDQDFLRKQGCMIPELNEKYTFTVQLRKYAANMLSGEKETTVIHESRESSAFDYTLSARWKQAPAITYASQTADGQITLQWEHDDNGLGCEYTVLMINKLLGIKTGETVWGTTRDNSFVVRDLVNGGYSVAVRPQYRGEKGEASEEVWLEIKNDWMVAPSFTCEQTGANQVVLTWPAVPNVEAYRLTVYVGDNASVLRYFDLDYTKYADIEIPAQADGMAYTFTYGRPYSVEEGVKIRFELCGIRHAANGATQKSRASTQVIVLH